MDDLGLGINEVFDRGGLFIGEDDYLLLHLMPLLVA